MKAVVLPRVLYHQALDMAADGAQPQPIQLRRAPRCEGHAAAVFGQHLGISRVGLGPAQRLRQSGELPSGSIPRPRCLRPIKRQRKVQRVNARRLQRYARPRLTLLQPGNQRLVPAGSVVENTLFESFIFLLNRNGQCLGTHIDAAKYASLAGDGSACSWRSLRVRFVSATAPVRANGLTLPPTLNMQAQRPPILHGVKREGRGPVLATGSDRSGLGWERPLRRNVTTSSRLTSQHTRMGCSDSLYWKQDK